MTTEQLERPAQDISLLQILREWTRPTHESLDGRIMAADPFANRENYGRFALVQYQFHTAVSPCFQRADLGRMLPDLAARDRLSLVAQDLADLGIAIPETVASPAITDLPTALGWLYTAEGSNLGAAILLKEAKKLGLGETFGARHLAGHPDGRGLHWREFTAAMNAAPLSAGENDRVAEGAVAAFAHVRSLVELYLFSDR